ncbi:hypothetical protein GBA52_019012 [Prunus armeniaca]|nr:hypothetical protein GBA52_019012 [Prunus armeniaca]
MAISPQAFPPRKRRPSAGAFMSPKFSDQSLLRCLLSICQEISSLEPLRFLLRRTSLSMIRKTNLLSMLFEDLVRNSTCRLLSLRPALLPGALHPAAEDPNSDRRLIPREQDVASHPDRVPRQLLPRVHPRPVHLARYSPHQGAPIKRRRRGGRFSAPKPMLAEHDEIVRGSPRRRSQARGIDSSASCTEEFESLQDEFQNQTEEKSKSQLIALVGLVRYAKCVLFGSSTSGSDLIRRKSSSELGFPVDFRCPISLELMRDPVAVATGQTYDRESIKLWIESGHNTCPKTGQTLAHTDLVPNRALRNLIAMWCREQRIPFETAENNKGLVNAVKKNKAALEATRMTASFLVNKLSVSQSMEAANGVVYELRSLAKTDSDCRACIAEAGAIPLLVRYLSSDVGGAQPNLQVNAVTAILNLSILEANKTRIMETDGALNGVIEVLRSGATWEAKGNAAATIFSLSGVHGYRKRLGRKTRVIKGLLELAKEGPEHGCFRRDAMVAILNLAGEREAVARLVEGGVVEMIVQVMEGLPEEAVTVLEAVVRSGGILAIAAAYCAIRKLGCVLREGSERARESAAATLVTICRKGGSEMVAELASMPGIERVIWELMGVGTVRARRKAASLLRILRRWAAGLDSEVADEGYSQVVSSSIAATTTVAG